MNFDQMFIVNNCDKSNISCDLDIHDIGIWFEYGKFQCFSCGFEKDMIYYISQQNLIFCKKEFIFQQG